MSEENTCNSGNIDPTAMGLFFVAAISLPLAIYSLLDSNSSVWNMGLFFTVGGILILSVSLKSYKFRSSFGYVVFGLVGYGVLMVGLCSLPIVAYPLGDYVMLTFALTYVLAVVWSMLIHTFKTMTLLLITTALVFVTVGLSGIIGGDYWHYLIGISALLNFLFNIYLAYSLALEGKIKCI